MDYNANGSCSWVQQFVNNETDLAGSDKPLDPAKGEPDRAQQRCGSPAWDLPAVFGPIAVTYNVAGVTSLNLDGPTTAKIFNGSIKDWNDPAIKALNADVNLPATPINVVFRDDKSGTTYNFQKYLDAASDGAPGAKAPTRRSTVESARARAETRAPQRLCGQPTGQSPTTNGRSRWATS